MNWTEWTLWSLVSSPPCESDYSEKVDFVKVEIEFVSAKVRTTQFWRFSIKFSNNSWDCLLVTINQRWLSIQLQSHFDGSGVNFSILHIVTSMLWFCREVLLPNYTDWLQHKPSAYVQTEVKSSHLGWNQQRLHNLNRAFTRFKTRPINALVTRSLLAWNNLKLCIH